MRNKIILSIVFSIMVIAIISLLQENHTLQSNISKCQSANSYIKQSNHNIKQEMKDVKNDYEIYSNIFNTIVREKLSNSPDTSNNSGNIWKFIYDAKLLDNNTIEFYYTDGHMGNSGTILIRYK